MTQPARIIRGIAANGESVVAELLRPVRNAGHPEWICAIRCPAISKKDREIAGADADQALTLAAMFVEELFDHHGIAIEKAKKN